MNPTLAIRGIALICAIAAIIPALLLERRRVRRGIGERPFTWGYFNGVACFLFGAVLLAIAVTAAGAERSDFPTILGGGLFFFCLYGLPGWFVIQRKRWAWVVVTILSLNPISWVAGYVYGRNRWAEFGTTKARPSD